jgi:tetratricopeptide (TPR) repeat protein
LKRQRRLYHGLAARWLEAETARSGRQGEFAALIAGHYEQAGETGPAAAWHTRAAGLAAGQYANQEAVRHYTRALELTPAEAIEPRHALLLGRLRVYDNLGDRPAQLADLLALKESAAALERPELTCQALLLHAEYAERIADLNAMVEYSGQAHALAAQAGLPVQQAQALLRRGQAYWRLGQYSDGAAQIQQALHVLGGLGNDALRGECLRNLGTIAYVQGNFQEAHDFHQRALAIQEQTGDLTACSHTNTSLGNVALRLGDIDNAERHFNLAIELSRKVNNPRREAGGLTNLGLVIEARGDYAAARQIYERAAAIFQRLQDWSGYSAAISNIGSTAMSLGDYLTAEQRFNEALSMQRRQNEVEGAAISLVNLGLLAVNTGDDAAALALCQEVDALTGGRGMRYLQAYALTYLGHASLGLGQVEQAAGYYTRSLELRREMRQPGLIMDNLAGLARTEMQRNDLPAALAQVEELLALLAEHGVDSVDEPVRVYTVCYRVLQAANDPRAAGVLDDAHALLVSRAWRISDEAQRNSYLHNVPANHELLQFWETRAQGRDGNYAG